MKAIWIKLSDDDYLLPEMIADSATKLSKMCGVSDNTIKTSYFRYTKGLLVGRPKFIKVEIDDD